MKTLKRIGIIVIAIILMLVVISLFLPAKVHVERNAVINAHPDVIFKQVNNLHNWNNWMPWNKMDPNIKIEYSGPEEGKGAGYSWTSENKNVGMGRIAITDSKPSEAVMIALYFAGNDPTTGSFKLEPAEGGTRIIWGMDMNMGMNPVGKYFGLFMDQMMGGDFEKGLADLKKIAESYTPPVVPELNPMPADSTASMEKNS